MGLKFRFGKLGQGYSEDQKMQYDELAAMYGSRVYVNIDEMMRDKEELDRQLREITGQVTLKTTGKYGQTVTVTMISFFHELANFSTDPEEKAMWMGFHDEMMEASVNLEDDPEESMTVLMYNTNDPEGPARYFNAVMEERIDDILQRARSAFEEKKRKLQVTEEFSADSLTMNTLNIALDVVDMAVKGVTEEQLTQKGDQEIANCVGTLMTGSGDYTKKRNGDPTEEVKISDYVRANRILPLQSPTIHALKTMSAYKNYQDRLAKNETTPDDEMAVRRIFISETAASLYDIQKIQKNFKDQRVKDLFPKIISSAATDVTGDREPFTRYRNTVMLRRSLIEKGWPLTDVDVLGKLANTAHYFEYSQAANKREWDRYESKLTEFQNGARKDKPQEPDRKRLTEDEISAMNAITEKLKSLSDISPANEEERNDILNSVSELIKSAPDSIRTGFPTLADALVGISKCVERKLTDAEKNLLADPSPLKQMFDENPVKEYTAEEQEKDIKDVTDLFEKDRELNDIYKTDPWAHDMVRAIQAHARNGQEFVDAVKSAIGEDAFNSFAAREGRSDDYSKAIDILTSPDSPYNVSDDHNIAERVRTSLIVNQKTGYIYSNVSQNDLRGIPGIIAGAVVELTGEENRERIDEAMKGNADFSKEQELLDRLNHVINDPGNMSVPDQQKEIASCIEGLLVPHANKALNGLHLDEDNLLERSYFTDKEPDLITGVKADGQQYINDSLAKRLQNVLGTVERSLDRAQELMKQENKKTVSDSLSALRSFAKNVRLGTLTSEIESMEPIVADENMRSGNIEYSGACYELKSIWMDFAAERKNGTLTPEKEGEYWNRINAQYDAIEAVYAAQPEEEEQEEVPEEDDDELDSYNDAGPKEIPNPFNDPDFLRRNGLEHMIPKAEVNKPVPLDEGVVEAGRKAIKDRREAMDKGWSLSDGSLYLRLKELKALTSRYVGREYEDAVHELDSALASVIEGPFGRYDPKTRQQRIRQVFDSIEKLNTFRDSFEIDRVGSDRMNPGRENLEKIFDSLDGLSVSPGPVFEKNVSAKPLLEEVKSLKNRITMDIQARALDSVFAELEQLKESGDIDNYVYEEIKPYIDRERTVPKQEYGKVVSAYNDLSDAYISQNAYAEDLAAYMGAVRNGTEAKLGIKTAMKEDDCLKAINRMLNNTDSFFHSDSPQFKSVKQALSKLEKGTLDDRGRQKLKDDVKMWLTDPKQKRIDNHGRNEFDNTRFNYMFTLANELDPKWAKENFDMMKLSILPGDGAKNSRFYDIHDFMNYTHRNIVDGGFLRNPQAEKNAKATVWYNKPLAAGDEGMVEEAERIRKDANYAVRDRLKVELGNLDHITGQEIEEPDPEMKKNLGMLFAYRHKLDNLVYNNEVVNERMEKTVLKDARDRALNQVKAFLEDPANSKSRIYQKALAAYGVIDPRAAHDYIKQYNLDHANDKKAKPVSLTDLEKKEGLDIGARKDYSNKKAARKAAKAKNASDGWEIIQKPQM